MAYPLRDPYVTYGPYPPREAAHRHDHHRPQSPGVYNPPPIPYGNASSHRSAFRPLTVPGPSIHPHRAPLPHPPAPPSPPRYPVAHPPAPPRPPSPRGHPSHPQTLPPLRQPALHPTFNYYQKHTAYDLQYRPPSPTGSRASEGSEIPGYRLRSPRGDPWKSAREGSTGSGHSPRHSPSPGPSANSGPGFSGGSVGSPSVAEDGNDFDANLDPTLRGYESDGLDGLDPQGDDGVFPPGSEKRPNDQYYPGWHHQQQFAALRKSGKSKTGINLNSLGDSDPNTRPQYSMEVIVKCAILGSPQERLTLNELYEAIEQRFHYFRVVDKKSWRNSLRHTLSLKNRFVRTARPDTEPGKGSYWMVNHNAPDGNKRERKRNKKPGKRALKAMEAEKLRQEAAEEAARNPPSPPPPPQKRPQAGSSMAIDPHVQPTMIPPAPNYTRYGNIGTVPATAGSYAAVTGAIPNPAGPDPRIWQPQTASTYQRVSQTSSARVRNRNADSSSTGSSDSPGLQRSRPTRDQRRYDPISTRASATRSPSVPLDNFNRLAAEFAAEMGMTEQPSEESRNRSRYRTPSDDDDSDDNYRPVSTRRS